LFGGAVLIDLGALLSGIRVFGTVSFWLMTIVLVVGLVTTSVQLVDFTTTPAGCAAHQVRALSSASMMAVVVGFTLAWYLRVSGHGAPTGGAMLLEGVAFLIGLAGAIWARFLTPSRGMLERRPEPTWPFSTQP
jgi:uncharacterized membrane protein